MTGMSFLQHLDELCGGELSTALSTSWLAWAFAGGFTSGFSRIMQKPIMSALASHHLDPKLVYSKSH